MKRRLAQELDRGLALTALILMTAGLAPAQQLAFSSGSDGSDGALTVPAGTTVVLDMIDHPDGIYNYTSVSIEANGVLEVTPNDNNAPLAMLVSGNFTMGNGAKILAFGENAGGQMAGIGGAGGFAGGIGALDSVTPQAAGPGLGPGGGRPSTQGGGPDGEGGKNTFMRPSLVPLIGGSGGGGAHANAGSGQNGGGGGGGGGALLIAVDGTFSMSVSSGTEIDCKGGAGMNYGGTSLSGGSGGSGGAIRIIANTVEGGWRLNVSAGAAGDSSFGEAGQAGDPGIIRIETFNLTRNFTLLVGTTYHSLPGLVDADGTDLSTLRISSIGGVNVPADAGANTAQPDVIIPAGVTNPVQVVVTATDVTPGQAAVVRINMDGAGGGP
jgi:hypothetical protein